MIKSMTGYGRCEVERENRKINVEMSSVNHRYCEISIRMPKTLMHLEESVRKLAKTFVTRGKVEINIFLTSVSEKDVEVVVNQGACEAYLKALRLLGETYGLKDNLGLAELIGQSDIVSLQKKNADLEALTPVLEEALKEALVQLVSMREKEGIALKEDVIQKAMRILELVGELESLSDLVVQYYKTKLEERLSKLLENQPVDENRMATEIALFADKCSIDEELTRLKSHVNQLLTILDEEGSIGRKLDFLMQELNREANTIASKANDYRVTTLAVELKSEIEKIREQIQNIE